MTVLFNKPSQHGAYTDYQKKHRKLLRLLKAKHTPSLGIIERIWVIYQGFKDGRQEIVRLAENKWTSTFIDKEQNKVNEFCSRVWGELQIENVPYEARITIILDALSELKKLVAEQDSLIEKSQKEAEKNAAVRKRGEERLSDSQISARRSREQFREVSKHQAKKDELNTQIQEMTAELTELSNVLIQKCNGVRFVCERMKDHTRQRIDVYWRSLLTTCPYSKELNAIPKPVFDTKAEEMYFMHHDELNKRINRRINDIESEVKE